MKGTRPLDNDEIRRVSRCFTGMYEVRNRGLFMLGVSTGGRISELLSLRVGDVYQNKKPVTDLLYGKSIVKGGEVSRSVPVNADGRRAIDELVNWHRRHYGNPIAKKRPLFPSRHKSGTVPMHRQTAHAILKTAFIEAGLNGHIATHSLRKSFAQRLYDCAGDIFVVQEMLGHRKVETTQKYLGVNYASLRESLEAMAVSGEVSEPHILALLGTSLKKETDKTLFLELALRGYDLSRLRADTEPDTPPKVAEVVKIG